MRISESAPQLEAANRELAHEIVEAERAEEMVPDRDYSELDLRTIHSDLPLACDLYIKQEERYVLYRQGSLPFTEADRERLLTCGVSHLWARSAVDTPPEQPLADLITLSDDSAPLPAKARALYGSAVSIARRLIADSVSPGVVSQAAQLVKATMDYVISSSTALPALLSAMLHDVSVYTHAVNVSVYALGMGELMGITDHHALRVLGLGALLHDVGKARVSKAILGKRGKLSAEEWAIIRQHPVWGVELLSSADVPHLALTIVLQHHERLDGSGYPLGLTRDDLHVFSRIAALVDAYDALTSHRSYRSALSPYAALSFLKKETGDKLDREIFVDLVRLLGNPLKTTLDCGQD